MTTLAFEMGTSRHLRSKDHRVRVGRERSARTETRILEAALRVFADLGPDAPKIDDFVEAADISRGTFYNYYDSVEELLEATSRWTTRAAIDAVETAMTRVDAPDLRFAVGMRLFFAHAEANPVWCRFVARVWKLGGLEAPMRDVDAGIRAGVFRAPSAAALHDVILGGVREALMRIGHGEAPRGYGAQMTEVFLRALGVESRRITGLLNHPLPEVRP